MTNTTPPPVDTKQPQASPQATPQEVVKLEDLEKQVLELTSQKLLSTYFSIKTDMTFDGIDGQAPNAKPTS